MKRLVLSSCIIALFVTLTVTGAAPAQDKFPSKPISVVVPVSAGGSTGDVIETHESWLRVGFDVLAREAA